MSSGRRSTPCATTRRWLWPSSRGPASAPAAGIELSMCCDLRIAAEDARIGLPEVTLGYIPSAGGTQLLPRIVRPGGAMGLLLSGDTMNAAEALRLGLVHRVVPRDRL